MTTLQAKMGFRDDDLKTPMHDKIMLWAQEHAAQIQQAVLGEPADRVPDVKWEIPVRPSGSTYVIGFIDMVIGPYLAVEIKTKIPNVGELLRQLNSYRQFSPWSSYYFVVISPDDRFADILRSQRIFFYKYEQAPLDEAVQ